MSVDLPGVWFEDSFGIESSVIEPDKQLTPKFLYSLNVNAQPVSVAYATALILAISLAVAALGAIATFALTGSLGGNQDSDNSQGQNQGGYSGNSHTEKVSQAQPHMAVSVEDSTTARNALKVLKAIDEASEKINNLETGTLEKAFYMQLQACIRIANDISHTEEDKNILLLECYNLMQDEPQILEEKSDPES